MPPSRASAASLANPWAWCAVGAGLAIYAVLATILVQWWVRLEPSVPGIVSFVAPPALYGALVAFWFKPLPMPRWAIATAGLWGAHLALGIITVGLVGLADGEYRHMPGLAFPPPPVPQILWVPLLLIPLRDVVAPPAAHRRRPPVRGEVAKPQALAVGAPIAPSAPAALGAPIVPRPAAPLGVPAPGPRPRVGRGVATASPAPAPPVERQPSVLVRPAPAREPAAAPSVTQLALDRMLASEHEAALIRIPFERVAGQFPPDMFRGSRADLAAALREPGHLVVPQRLALVQLAEGVVRVGWEVVADQFPRDLLAMGDEGVKRRLPDAQIVLPLDEVVRQMPGELFTSEPGPELPFDAEDIPDLFLPPAGSPAVAAELLAPPPPPRETVVTPASREVESRRRPDPRKPSDAVTIAEPAPIDPVTPARAGGGQAGAAPAPEVVRDPRRDLAVRLFPLVPLQLTSEEAPGLSLLTLASPRVDGDLATAAVRIVLSALNHPHAPRPIDQITLRGPDTAVVVTPLGHGAGVLVVAVPRSASLGLVELVCRRQAGDAGLPAGATHAATDRGTPSEPLEVERDARFTGLTSALDAVGPLRGSTLRDPRDGRLLQLFLPDGSDVRAAGAFTADLARALLRAPQTGGLDTVIVRGGEHRMIVRLAGAGGGAVVAAVGETRAPGLAHRQVAEIAGAVTS